MIDTPVPRWRLYLLPAAWTLIILLLSGDLGSSAHTTGLIFWLLSHLAPFSPPTILQIHDILRKTAHVVAYGLLFVLYYRAFWHSGGQRRLVSIGAAMGLCLIVALVDEGRQVSVASRSGRLADVLLDMAGVVGLGLLAALTRLPRPRLPQESKMGPGERVGGA
uniref:VanZ-like domain-containing protein n=1 Tax=Desulfobacca acetoxidans TaxID=60893 RepID=A0A7V4G9D4_9BACT